jgi:dihydrofolate reductase
MGKVATGLSMSLDGFIAGPNDGPGQPLGEGGERLFEWFSAGDTEYGLPGTEMVFRVSQQSAEMLREAHAGMGAFVTGRRTFDISNGWGGSPPLGVPTFVVTHAVPDEWVYEGSPFTFVTDGVESAVERRGRSRATRTSPWAPPASRSSASGRESSTRYTWTLCPSPRGWRPVVRAPWRGTYRAGEHPGDRGRLG